MCSLNISFTHLECVFVFFEHFIWDREQSSYPIFTEKDTWIEFHFIEAERVYDNNDNMYCIYIVFP